MRIDEAEDDLAEEGDEEVEEGDEAEEGDEGEGEGEGDVDVDEAGEEADDAAITTAKATPTLTPAPGVNVTEPATPMETDSEMPPPATIVIAEPTPEVTPAPELPPSEPETATATVAATVTPAAPAQEATPTPTPTPGDHDNITPSGITPGDITPAENSIAEEPVVPVIPVEEATAPAGELTSHEIPSNAIEMSNTAPGSTEVGHGDLGAEAGVEITLPTPHSPGKTAEEAAAEHATGVVEHSTGVVESESSAEVPGVTDTTEVEVADEPMDVDEPAPPVPPVRDEGLTMADHEPERKEFEVEHADEPREVALPGEDA